MIRGSSSERDHLEPAHRVLRGERADLRVPLDPGALGQQVGCRVLRLAGQPHAQAAGVGVRVEGDDPVAAVGGEGVAEHQRGRRLAGAALPGEHDDAAGPVDPRPDPRSRASSRRSRLLGPGLTCPPVTAKTLRRHPCRGVRGWARSRNRSVSSSAVRVNTGAVPVAGADTVAGADEATADAYGIGEAGHRVGGWVVGSDPDIGISSGWSGTGCPRSMGGFGDAGAVGPRRRRCGAGCRRPARRGPAAAAATRRGTGRPG